MVKINGEFIDADGKTVFEFLSTTDYDIRRIAIELNGEILSKTFYAEVTLKNGDEVEIVSFVGGG